MKKIVILFFVLHSCFSYSQCLKFLMEDLAINGKEFKALVNENSGFKAWQVLAEHAPSLRTDLNELNLVSKNLEAIEKAGGYTKWKGLYKARDWKSIQHIANKFPTEEMPLDGQLWGIAEIESGYIKQMASKGNTFNDVDFVITTNGELKIGKKHHFLGNASSVEAAGTIKTVNGKLKKISNSSGHYFPTVDETNKFPEIFRQLGIDTKGASLEIKYLDDAGNLKTQTKFITE
ncbi:hypothetical protein [Flavobacterium sp. MMS24-S5]|uniref:hypothetical protein n=1 Tax=Flavobacterium sp. MMS24-S5 TaxID=3416605 RepID=UPI003D00A137